MSVPWKRELRVSISPSRCGDENEEDRQRNRAVSGGRQPVREYDDGAFVTRAVGVVMKPVVRLRARCEEPQHQYQGDASRADQSNKKEAPFHRETWVQSRV